MWSSSNSLCHTLRPLHRLRPGLLTSRCPGGLRGSWRLPVWNGHCGGSCCSTRCSCGVLGGVLSGSWWRLRLWLRGTRSWRLRFGFWGRVSFWWRGFCCTGLGDLADDRRGCCCWRAGRARAAATWLELEEAKVWLVQRNDGAVKCDDGDHKTCGKSPKLLFKYKQIHIEKLELVPIHLKTWSADWSACL